ncbi:uncharacterized protein DFL_009384 [Arthrobotrys flagrans]|uniref:JmjC domain-containing protein n=1 Tax=Arthrobotrys flagrans TaxID=97331 RepID=A0A436ZRH7_ARTFL|nr:hypothetical protein DFL_009384 [Arthrobotrys flagrans]
MLHPPTLNLPQTNPPPPLPFHILALIPLPPPHQIPPTLLPPHTPAFENWFLPIPPYNLLNTPYFTSLNPSSSLEIQVPIEITLPSGDVEMTSFPFSDFLEYLSAKDIDPEIPKLYLTQHPPPHFLLNDLPPPFQHLGFKIRPLSRRHQNPTSATKSSTNPNTNPNLKSKATETEGRGQEQVNLESENKEVSIDIYTTSLWLSRTPLTAGAQTHTPLHRDPLHNIFLQLSSSKSLITLPPLLGSSIFTYLHRHHKLSSTDPRGHIRDGLLTAKESGVLDRVIWGEMEDAEDAVEEEVINLLARSGEVYETVVERGEAVFIPEGWWHTLKSVIPDHDNNKPEEEERRKGRGGVVASMNWWFR